MPKKMMVNFGSCDSIVTQFAKSYGNFQPKVNTAVKAMKKQPNVAWWAIFTIIRPRRGTSTLVALPPLVPCRASQRPPPASHSPSATWAAGSGQGGRIGRRRQRNDGLGVGLEADLAHAKVADHEP